MADYDNYASCLGFAGLNGVPSGYYAHGFRNSVGPFAQIQSNGATGCTAGDLRGFDAAKSLAGQAVPNLTHLSLPLVTDVAADGSTFIAGASGYIFSQTAGSLDQWSIDENKTILNVQTGY